VPKGLGALERGGTRESGRATYLGYEKRYVLDAEPLWRWDTTHDLWLVEPRLGYEKRYWMLLRQDERHAARVLGYEAATWEGGGETEACSRPWDALVADELSAALLLGYSSQSWGEEHEAVEEALRWVTTDRHDMTDRLTACREPPSPAVLLLA